MTKRKAAKAHSTYRRSAPKAAAKKARGTYRKTSAQFEEFVGDAQMPESMRTLAEKSVVQTRELCEHSLEAVLESWERLVDAGQGAVALNRKAIDIARHNINTGFGFAVSLARAKNLAEVMELQAVYWRKQLGALTAQAEAFRIDTEGKRSDELLNMVREQRNNPARLRSQARGDRNAATHEKASQ